MNSLSANAFAVELLICGDRFCELPVRCLERLCARRAACRDRNNSLQHVVRVLRWILRVVRRLRVESRNACIECCGIRRCVQRLGASCMRPNMNTFARRICDVLQHVEVVSVLWYLRGSRYRSCAFQPDRLRGVMCPTSCKLQTVLAVSRRWGTCIPFATTNLRQKIEQWRA